MALGDATSHRVSSSLNLDFFVHSLSPLLPSARVVNLIDARRQLRHKRRRGHRDFALAGQRQRVREILLGVEQLNALTRLELLAVQDLVR